MSTLQFVFAIVLLCCSISHSLQNTNKGSPRTFTDEEVSEICSKLRSPNSPIRCKGNDEDLALPGKLFLKQNPNKPLSLSPVVMLPGFGGSALEAKLHKNDTPAWYCFQEWDWFRLWIALDEIIAQTCWFDNQALDYDPSTDTYANTDGVDIRGIDFGGTSGIDYLTYILGFPVTFTSIYGTMIQSFEAVGYEAGVNLRGVPYDWRLPSDAHEGDLYDRIQQLIEETYQQNGNTKVHVIAHSLGGPVFLHFLNSMTDAWRTTYMESFIPIAGPWSGSPKALRGLVSGDNFGMEFLGFSIVDPLTMRSVARTYGGLVALIPDPTFWGDQVFVIGPQKNYTASDFLELFQDLGADMTASIYPHTEWLFPNMTAPMVPTYCLYGTDQPTELYYDYSDGDYNSDPVIYYTNEGDGTVPLRSLKECVSWQNDQQNVVIQEFDESDHTSILEDQNVINYILNIITAP